MAQQPMQAEAQVCCCSSDRCTGGGAGHLLMHALGLLGGSGGGLEGLFWYGCRDNTCGRTPAGWLVFSVVSGGDRR